MLGHHAEGRHVAQFPDIGRRQRQRNAHHIVGDGVAGVLGFRNLAVFRGLGLKIGAAVGLIVLEGEKDIFCRHGLSVGPGHSVLNGVGPGGGVEGLLPLGEPVDADGEAEFDPGESVPAAELVTETLG